MAFNASDGFHMSIQNSLETTRFVVEKITDTFLGQDNKIYYKVKWQETWEPEERVMLLCAQLVNEFWKEYYARTQQARQTLETPILETPGVPSSTETNEITNQALSLQQIENVYLPPKITDNSSIHNKSDQPAVIVHSKDDPNSLQISVEALKQNMFHQTIPTQPHKLIESDGSNTFPVANTPIQPMSSLGNLRFASSLLTKKAAQMFLQPRLLNSTSTNLINQNFTPSFVHPELSKEVSKELSKTRQNSTATSKSKGNKKLMCKTCQMELGSKLLLKKHMETEHLEVTIFACETCGKTFGRKTLLNRHMLKHTSTRTHVCEKCGKGFKEKSNLTKHMVIHTGVRPHTCNICNARFRQLSHLAKHVLVHNPDKPFKCDFCMKSFKRKEHLKDHLVIHSGQFPYQCEVCQKKFRFKTNLRVHFVQHSRKKDFVCETCGKAFIGKANLTQHLLIHQENFSFSCEICSKKFKRKGHLQRHIEIHKDGKLLSCILCEEEFKTKSEYNKHLLIHAGSKPFVCAVCGVSFPVKSHLLSHIKNHSYEKNNNNLFECLCCSEKLSSNLELEKHIEEFHKAPWCCSTCQQTFESKVELSEHRLTSCRIVEDENEKIL